MNVKDAARVSGPHLRLWRNLLIAAGLALALLQFFRVFHGKQTTFIANDGDWYYASCASLYFDHDLDLSNQMNTWAARAHTTPPNVVPGRPTRTAFTIGSALLWMPAFAAGDLATWIGQRLGVPVARDGYTMSYQLAVALATLIYGLIGVWFALKAAAWWMDRAGGGWRHGPALAAATAVCASPALYYLVFEPTMTHGPSIFTASLLVWLWFRTEPSAKWGRWAALGLVAGLGTLIRPQDSLLLVLPLSTALRGGWRQASGRVLLIAAASLLVFSPQMVIWQFTHGQPLVIPQGPGYMRWWDPHPLQVWFSPHHGLFTWTPIWLIALLGLASLPRQARPAVAAMLAVFLLESYVNSCTRDWWAGDAFGSRRFLSQFPTFVLGLSAVASKAGVRYPKRIVAVSAVAVIANLALMGLYLTGRLAHG